MASHEGRPYTVLGEMLDALARRRNVRGASRIANHMEERLPGQQVPSGKALAKWLYGDSRPTQRDMQLFADAFELDRREKVRLAWAYTFDERGPAGRAHFPGRHKPRRPG